MDSLGFAPVGSHTQNAALNVAVALTKPGLGENKLLVQVSTQNVRYTLDGTTPTASKGFQILAGEKELIPITGKTTVTVIEEVASASIDYQFGS